MKLTAGFSFIEILISMLLLSLIFLGMDGAGVYALHNDKNAWVYRVAFNQLSNMTERLRVVGDDNQYLKQQIEVWNRQNAEILPNGKGTVIGEYPSYIVSVSWGEVNDIKTSIQEKITI